MWDHLALPKPRVHDWSWSQRWVAKVCGCLAHPSLVIVCYDLFEFWVVVHKSGYRPWPEHPPSVVTIQSCEVLHLLYLCAIQLPVGNTISSSRSSDPRIFSAWTPSCLFHFLMHPLCYTFVYDVAIQSVFHTFMELYIVDNKLLCHMISSTIAFRLHLPTQFLSNTYLLAATRFIV